jgi:activator of HSP90 ATPase
MKTIHQQYRINAPLAIVWQALTNPKVINQWGGGNATMSEKEGEPFTLWGGEIWGKNIEVIKESKLVQEWHDDKTTNGMRVTLTLEKEKDITRLTLLHEHIPDNKYDDLNKGWKEYYLQPLSDFVTMQTTES